MLRYFWDAAASVDPDGVPLDEGQRFPICRPDALQNAFRAAGIEEVTVRPLVVATTFRDFDDYWAPFLDRQGAAPHYLSLLSEAQTAALRQRLSADLPRSSDGTIRLAARAWAARGIAGGHSAPARD